MSSSRAVKKDKAFGLTGAITVRPVCEQHGRDRERQQLMFCSPDPEGCQIKSHTVKDVEQTQ